MDRITDEQKEAIAAYENPASAIVAAAQRARRKPRRKAKKKPKKRRGIFA